MMKQLHLKFLILLCALMVGSGSVWADEFNFTYNSSDHLSSMLSGSYESANGYWKVPASAGNTATIAIPIVNQPTSDIKITFNIATYGTGNNPTSDNTTITAVGTEDNSNWAGSGVSSYPTSSTYGDGVMTITKPDSPTTLGGLTITMGVNSGVKIFRLKSIKVSYEYSASSVATPTFSLGEGTYTSTQSVAISCETAGTTIYYTLDGSNPTSSSSVYSEAISISETTTVKAMAKIDDDESAIATATYTILPVTHAGTSADPYTISDARNALTAGIINSETDYYVKGYITKKNDISNGSLTYWLSDNGEMTSTIQCYSGKYIGGVDFTDANDLEVGDIATVKGKLAIYSGSTYQFNSGNEVVSIEARTKVNIATFTATTNTLVLGGTTSTNTSVTNDQAGWTPANYTYASDDETVATVNASGVVTAVAKGTANITVTPVVSATDPNFKVGASKSIEIVVKNPSHTASFSVNGVSSDALVEEGDDITFPEDPADILDKKFVGWVSTPIEGTTDTAPTWVSSSTMGNEDVTYYAVFASGTQANGWEKLAVSEVSEEGIYALLTTDGYAFNGSITSGHGQKTTDAFTFTNNFATSAPEGTCEITLQAVTGGFKMYNSDNDKGYLYASKAASGGLAWHKSEDSYWSSGSGNWKYYSNSAYLRSYNNSSFRTYGANNGDVLVFAHKTTISSYSGYCTSITTSVPITLNAACTDGRLVYGTYSSSSAFEVSDDIIVYEVNLDSEGKLNFEAYNTGDIVPANTGVVVASDAGGEHTVVLTTEEGQSVLGTNNLLRASGDGITADDMATADPNCKYYRLTMHNGTDIGFWWGAADGAAFDMGANKAYLVVPVPNNGQNVRQGFEMGGDANGISDLLRSTDDAQRYYNLQGQRVMQPTKGLYIVNGKKMIKQ